MLEHDDLHQLICKDPLQVRGERRTERRRKNRSSREKEAKGGRVNERKLNHEERRQPEKRKGRRRERKREEVKERRQSEARGENRAKQEYLLMKDEKANLYIA